MKILSYEEIEQIFQGGEKETAEKTEEETAEESPTEEAPARRVIGKAKPKVELVPEEDEEDQILDAEVPPKGKTKSVTASEVPDCIACDGTGKTSKGKGCPICGGTGKDEDNEDDTGADTDDAAEEEEDPPEKPVKKAIRKSEAEEETPVGRRVVRR